MKNYISFSTLNSLIFNILKMVNIRIEQWSVLSYQLLVLKLLKNRDYNLQRLVLLLPIAYCLLIYCNTVNAQFFDTETYGSPLSDVVTSIDGDENRNLYVTGSFRQTMLLGSDTLTSNGDSDIFLAHLDSTGAPIWATSFGNISGDIGNDVVYKDGFLYVAGFFWDTLVLGNITLTASFGSALFISKWNAADGTIVWAKRLNGDGIKGVADVEVADDLSIYMTGHFNQSIDFDNISYPSPNHISGFLVKYDNNGLEQWSSLLGSSGGDAYGKHIGSDANGNTYFVGDFDGSIYIDGLTLNSSANDKNGFLAKFNSTGQLQWANELSGVGDVEIADVELADRTVFVAGHYQNSLNFGTNFIQTPTIDFNVFVAKYWDSGALQDVLNLGNSSDEYLTSIDIESEQLMLGGYFFGDNDFNGITFSADPLVAVGYGYVADTSLGLEWANYLFNNEPASPNFHDVFVNDVKLSAPTTFPDLSEKSYRAMVGTFEGNLVSPYDSLSSSNGSFDWFVAFGLIDVLTDVETIIEETIDFKIYPNPVSQVLNIELPIEQGQIIISNSIGQQVYVTTFENQQHQINVKGLKSGIYLISIVSNDKRVTKQFVKY